MAVGGSRSKLGPFPYCQEGRETLVRMRGNGGWGAGDLEPKEIKYPAINTHHFSIKYYLLRPDSPPTYKLQNSSYAFLRNSL